MKLNEFKGSRLRTARNYRGMSPDALASKSGINKKDIQAFEEEKYFPTLENSMLLAGTLEFPREFFYTSDIYNVGIEWIHFDSKSKSPKNVEISNREKLVMINRIYNFMRKYLMLPDKSINFKDMGEVTDVEKIAEWIREKTDVDDKPILDMTGFMEKEGFVITDMNVFEKYATPISQKQISKTYDVYGQEKESKKTVFFISLGGDGNIASERNMSLAGEFGAVAANELGISMKNFDTSEFAMAFLLPENMMRDRLKNSNEIDEYLSIASEWIVPVYAVVTRAFSLGIISYRKYIFLMEEIEKRKWSEKDPVSVIIARPPYILREGMNMLLKEVFTPETIIEALESDNIYIYPNEIEKIMGLDPGKLGSSKSKVVNINKFRDKQMNKTSEKNKRKSEKKNKKGKRK